MINPNQCIFCSEHVDSPTINSLHDWVCSKTNTNWKHDDNHHYINQRTNINFWLNGFWFDYHFEKDLLIFNKLGSNDFGRKEPFVVSFFGSSQHDLLCFANECLDNLILA